MSNNSSANCSANRAPKTLCYNNYCLKFEPLSPQKIFFYIQFVRNNKHAAILTGRLDCYHFQRYGITNSNELTSKLLSQQLLYMLYKHVNTSTNTFSTKWRRKPPLGSEQSREAVTWLSFYLWTVRRFQPDVVTVVIVNNEIMVVGNVLVFVAFTTVLFILGNTLIAKIM